MQISYIDPIEIKRIRKSIKDKYLACQLFSDICRLNTLSMIEEAGSGHIGTSFSCLDILTWLWTQELGGDDVCFSSKGHDVPAFYSIFMGLEKLDFSLIHKLRRLNGLPGHPDIHTQNIVTNTGSLGMGISKAKGMALANRLNGKKSHIYVLCGDGELQEGQIWESLQPAANNKLAEITLIVDHNKLQSDTWVSKTSDLGLLENKFKAFGWEVFRCDGHNFNDLEATLKLIKQVNDKPQVLIADTIKGKGASTLESTQSVFDTEFYNFHSGAVESNIYDSARDELLSRINDLLAKQGISTAKTEVLELPEKIKLQNAENLVNAYGDELLKLMKENEEIVALDADLIKDCGLAKIRDEFPERSIECGIAEQDMVSTAGGLALKGKIPVVHSFACFLSARPNEQIYNNATEKTKIIYTGSLAGILPATPGHSHQSVRDISLLGSVPNLTLIEPCNEQEARMAIRWAIEQEPMSTYLRLVSTPFISSYKLPENYSLAKGCGVLLRQGADVACIAYGPTMLAEAFKAALILEKKNIQLAIFNFPWLNKLDLDWLKNAVSNYRYIVTLDDHYLDFGQGQLISSALNGFQNKILSLGIKEIPACGQVNEVLTFHGLDGQNLAKSINEFYIS